jgi:endonuclease/exonuclease/phosphatase family metal-dependent hydrolase
MTLTVVTWNVLADAYLRAEYYPHLDELPAARARSGAIDDELRSIAAIADVIALQDAESHVADLAAGLDGFDSHWEQRPGRHDGTLLAVRRELRPTFTAAHVACGDHVQVSAVFHVGGRTVTATSVHLSWSDARDDHPGVTQIGHVDADIVCGDLNAGAGPVIDALGAAGYRCAFPDLATAVINGHEPATIDAVCVRGDLRVSAVDVLAFAARPLPDAEFPSDHVPVAATVTL